MTTERVLDLVGKVPWALLLALFGIPYLRQMAKKIKDDQLRAAYLRVVRYIEMTYGANSGTKKKLEAKAVIVNSGLPFDQVMLEAAVHEVKREALPAAPAAT